MCVILLSILSKYSYVLPSKIDKLVTLKSKDISITNIQRSLSYQKEVLVKALMYTPNETNNLAERELRPIVINRKISYGSDTYKGMKTIAVLSSIVQTISKSNKQLFPELKHCIKHSLHSYLKSKSQPEFQNSS